MRDFGTLIWAIVIVVGVISSMVRNARKRAAPPSAPERPADDPTGFTQSIAAAFDARVPVAPPKGARRSVRPVARVAPAPALVAPAPEASPEALPHDPFHSSAARRRAALFLDRASVRRAIVAAEVLGPPVALRPQRETNGPAW